MEGKHMCTENQLVTIQKLISEKYKAVYGGDLSEILLYGSYARGDNSEDSDIDIAAIVHGSRLELQHKLKELWNTAAQLSLDYDIVISPTVIPYDEYEAYKTSLPYYRRLLHRLISSPAHSDPPVWSPGSALSPHRASPHLLLYVP